MYPRLAAVSLPLICLVSPASADMDVAGYLKADGASILLWLIFLSAMILAGALTVGKMRRALEVLTLVWGFCSLFFISMGYGLLFILVDAIGLTIGVAEEHKVRRALKSDSNPKKTASILAILAAIIILSQINLLRAELDVKSSSIAYTGFSHLQPVISSVSYKNDAFKTNMKNTLDSGIEIRGVSVTDAVSKEACSSVDFPRSEVGPGKTLTLGGSCPEKLKNEAYDLLISVNYTTVSRGITINSIESGHIKKAKEENS